MASMSNRKNAILNGIKSCKYEAEEQEICNYSEMFKALHFFRLLKKFCELDSIIKEKQRERINLSIDIQDHRLMKIMYKEKIICIFKYDEKGTLKLIINNEEAIDIQDDIPLAYSQKYVDLILCQIQEIDNK